MLQENTDEQVKNGEDAGAGLVRIQPLISEDAARRLRIEVARRGLTQGQIVTEALLAMLPADV